MTKHELKKKAQDELLDAISLKLGYWPEQLKAVGEVLSENDSKLFDAELQKQANRIARLFGYAQAWRS